jgi:hypothetical protein
MLLLDMRDMWQSHTDWSYAESPLRDPQPLHGGHDEPGHPVYLTVNERPVRVRAVIDHWTVHEEFGVQGVAAFAWRVELANGEQWYVEAVSKWPTTLGLDHQTLTASLTRTCAMGLLAGSARGREADLQVGPIAALVVVALARWVGTR